MKGDAKLLFGFISKQAYSATGTDFFILFIKFKL